MYEYKHLYISYDILICMVTAKINLKCPDPIWNEVKKYGIDNGLNNNDAAVSLIEKGLKKK